MQAEQLWNHVRIWLTSAFIGVAFVGLLLFLQWDWYVRHGGHFHLGTPMTVAVLVTLYIAKHSYDEWARRVVVEHRLKLVTAANSEIRNALTALSAQLYLFGLNKQEYQPIKREVDRITGALNRVVPIRPEKREDWLTKISGL